MNCCLQCKSELKGKYNLKFCSRSCSTKFKNTNNHSTKGKGKGKPKCATDNCQNKTVSYSHKFCRKCIDEKQIFLWSKNPTKKQLEEQYIKKNHRSSAYSYIRWHAREIILKDKTSCANCGYDKHTEVCHIKPIQSFNDQCTLNEINSKENLIRLCPNCHWEYDNGLLKWRTRHDSNVHTPVTRLTSV